MSWLDDNWDDAAQWRAQMRDPSWVRAECPVITRLMKQLGRIMAGIDDPEDWAAQLRMLTEKLPGEDIDHLPHEIGFLLGLA